MIPISLIIIYQWDSFKKEKTNLIISLSLPVILFGAYFIEPTRQAIRKSTDKYMVQKSIDQEKALYALLFKSYSSQFYSKGKIKVLTPIELENMVKSKKKFSIIIQNRHKSRVSQNVIEKLNPQIIRKNDGLYTIN